MGAPRRVPGVPILTEVILSWLRWNLDKGYVRSSTILQGIFYNQTYDFTNPGDYGGCLASVSRCLRLLSEKGLIDIHKNENTFYLYRAKTTIPAEEKVNSFQFKRPTASDICLSVLRNRTDATALDLQNALLAEKPHIRHAKQVAHRTMLYLEYKGLAVRYTDRRRDLAGRMYPVIVWKAVR